MRRTLAFEIGDIADRRSDAIVNPVGGGWLVGYAGVNGAFRRRGGPTFAVACDQLGEGEGRLIRVTGGGELHARWVLHVLSPIWRGGNAGEARELASLHRQIVERADLIGCTSLAIPAVGCGAHGFPTEVAAGAAVPAVEDALARTQTMRRIELVFESTVILTDYAARQSDQALAAVTRDALRTEIVCLLVRRPELVERVARVDEDRLRAIDTRARSLLGELRNTSLSISAAYTQAAELELAI
jgi:O-acetyl-ADP-ribose deacetylase (regulator of RNase III)